ncbi:MAG: hypothetical protein AAGJ28_15010 [Pseudomonadota bacterium]
MKIDHITILVRLVLYVGLGASIALFLEDQIAPGLIIAIAVIALNRAYRHPAVRNWLERKVSGKER